MSTLYFSIGGVFAGYFMGLTDHKSPYEMILVGLGGYVGWPIVLVYAIYLKLTMKHKGEENEPEIKRD